MRTIAGAEYAAAALSLRILVLSLPFTFAAMLCISALLAPTGTATSGGSQPPASRRTSRSTRCSCPATSPSPL